jgi:hypothetical protein
MKLFMTIVMVVMILAGCGSRTADRVLVIQKAKMYHIETCPRVKMANAVFMTREDALALNCKPCPGCKPDGARIY